MEMFRRTYKEGLLTNRPDMIHVKHRPSQIEKAKIKTTLIQISCCLGSVNAVMWKQSENEPYEVSYIKLLFKECIIKKDTV